MIDWEATLAEVGYGAADRVPKKVKVVTRCDDCGVAERRTKFSHYVATRRHGRFL